MTDTTDNQILETTMNDAGFQDRCRLRFINAAISVTNEIVTVATSALTATGSAVLNFTAVPASVVVGMTVTDATTPAVIPAATTVKSKTATTVTLSANVLTPGVASGDNINFTPVSHTQRLAFAGALFAGSVDLKMLAMTIVANTTNRTNILANSSLAGGNTLDADIDFQVNSVFTGIATARSW